MNASKNCFSRACRKNSKVVTTLKKSEPQKWTWSGARFTRQTASKKQLDTSNRLQLYKRARFYDPTTGEFITKDPLEYVDGMSMYRGYFIDSGTDPSGLSLTQEQCESEVNRLLEPGGRLWLFVHMLRARGCYDRDAEIADIIRDHIKCKKCSDSPVAPTKGGHFDDINNEVVICIDDPGLRINHVFSILRHELTHASDFCEVKPRRRNRPGRRTPRPVHCDFIYCSEVRAYSFDLGCSSNGRFRRTGETRVDCIKRKAWDSLGAIQRCNHYRSINRFDDGDFSDHINGLFNNCHIPPKKCGKPLPPAFPPDITID